MVVVVARMVLLEVKLKTLSLCVGTNRSRAVCFVFVFRSQRWFLARVLRQESLCIALLAQRLVAEKPNGKRVPDRPIDR